MFLEMKAHGKGSRNPVKDAFGDPKTLRIVLVTIFGAVAGQASKVVQRGITPPCRQPEAPPR